MARPMGMTGQRRPASVDLRLAGPQRSRGGQAAGGFEAVALIARVCPRSIDGQDEQEGGGLGGISADGETLRAGPGAGPGGHIVTWP